MATPLHHVPLDDNSRALPLQPHQWSLDHSVRAAASAEVQSIASTNRNFAASVESATKEEQAFLLSQSNHQIERKLAETASLESEASRQLRATEEELRMLEEAMNKTEAALVSKELPIQRTDDWLATRANRPQSEAMRDNVEIAIDALASELRESVVLLQSTIAAEASEIRRLQTAIAALSADIADKQTALDIDRTTREISQAQPSMRDWQFTSKGPYVGPEWRGSTTSICTMARQIVAVSVRLRVKAAQVEAECARKEAASKANLIYQHENSLKRLYATIQVSEQEIAKLDDEAQALRERQQSTEASLSDKEQAVAVATERLHTRNQRPDRERVHDGAQIALQNELRVLSNAAHELARQIQRCLDDQARVAAAKEKVESDMFNKQTFLHYEEALRDIEIPLSA